MSVQDEESGPCKIDGECTLLMLPISHYICRYPTCSSFSLANQTHKCDLVGSLLEGGGQILRNAAALSAITATPIEVTRIRAGRSKPGLRAQHLAGLQLVVELCQGKLEGGAVGSQHIKLTPKRITSGYHLADTKTAGSCMLLAQASSQACTLFLP